MFIVCLFKVRLKKKGWCVQGRALFVRTNETQLGYGGCASFLAGKVTPEELLFKASRMF